MKYKVMYHKQKPGGGFEPPVEVGKFDNFFDACDFAKAQEEKKPGYYAVESL